MTAVLTSCGRYDLLQRTLDSFFSFNSAPIVRMIVVEDGPEIPASVRQLNCERPIEWINTGRRVGQIAAVDYAYSRVDTPYIFHLEDDWEFYRPAFIERSLLLLQADPACLQVWIRSVEDTQRHPIEADRYLNSGIEWRKMALDYDIGGVKWHGFSFNPGLRRLKDYVAIGGYGIHGRYDFHVPWKTESVIGDLYRQQGFYAAILSDQKGVGYVRHLGRGLRVAPPRTVAADALL